MSNDKKPELIRKKQRDGSVKLIIKNAGVAGKIFQHKIVEEKNGDYIYEFQRVVPAGGFIGTYNDPHISKSFFDALREKNDTYLDNSVIVDTDKEADSIIAEIKKHFKPILEMVERKKHKFVHK
jgi:hypothetical protein